jgi:hypothetical protein
VLIIVDHKISSGAKKKLSRFGELMEIQTHGITYPAISGHPDIFFCQSPGCLFVAPNLPGKYFEMLKKHRIEYITGELPAGNEYPDTARYNAVATDKYLIHNFRHTDPVIRDSIPTHRDSIPTHRDSIPVPCSSTLARLQVEQGYTRCNLLPLREGHFITSDEGIFNILQGRSPCVIYINPLEIKLEDFPHGFFGGCCGVLESMVFINGSLWYHPDGHKIRDFLESLHYEIIELSDGQLTDVGSVLFV